jgi:hypothetical protein
MVMGGTCAVWQGTEKHREGETVVWALPDLNNFKIQMHANLFLCKRGLPKLKKFEIKYGCEGFSVRNIFPY